MDSHHISASLYRCTLKIRFTLSTSTILGTATYQATLPALGSKPANSSVSQIGFLLCYLHKHIEAEMQHPVLSNERSVTSRLCCDRKMEGSPWRQMLRNIISSVVNPFLSLLPPAGARFHPEGAAEPGTKTLHLSQASEGGDESMTLWKELLTKPVAKAD